FRGRLVAEGDDLMLVELLTGEETQTRVPQAMQDEILMLLGCFAAYKVQHIFREGNQVAHVLCKEAYQRPGVWAGGIVPHAVWEKAQDDVHGVAHERLCKKKL
uniref:RNase H type-1 domain-containing protein n=2 Tax=Aegilops tauschii TaxID=37682 RepID=A0A453PQ61_AEGTS